VIGKGLSGGYAPLSAVVASREIVATIASGSGAFAHAQTYSHTPVVCAAGLATVRYLKDHRLVERSAAVGASLLAKLDTLRSHPAVGDVRGIGMLAAVEIVEDRESKRPFARSARVAERVTEAALRNGMVLWPNTGHLASGDGDILMIGPPFTAAEWEVDEIVARLGAALEECLGR
jgi:adenosylmethionine-8-amino-7-oxononanoate aminotransferase